MEYWELILDAITRLRVRKSRPDLDNILAIINKTEPELSRTVLEERLARLEQLNRIYHVHYKGHTSYRLSTLKDENNLHRKCDLDKLEHCGSLSSDTDEETRANVVGMLGISSSQLAADGDSKLAKKLQVSSNEGCSEEDKDFEPRGCKRSAEDQKIKLGESIAEPGSDEQDFEDHSQQATLEQAVAHRPSSSSSSSSEHDVGFESQPNGNLEQSSASSVPSSGPRVSGRKRIKKTHGPDWQTDSPQQFECKLQLCTCAVCRSKDVCNNLLACSACKVYVHARCLKLTERSVAKISANKQFYCLRCKPCKVCHYALESPPESGEQRASTLHTPTLVAVMEGKDITYCCQCYSVFHLRCLRQAPQARPKDQPWMCRKCSSEAEKKEKLKAATVMVSQQKHLLCTEKSARNGAGGPDRWNNVDERDAEEAGRSRHQRSLYGKRSQTILRIPLKMAATTISGTCEAKSSLASAALESDSSTLQADSSSVGLSGFGSSALSPPLRGTETQTYYPKQEKLKLSNLQHTAYSSNLASASSTSLASIQPRGPGEPLRREIETGEGSLNVINESFRAVSKLQSSRSTHVMISAAGFIAERDKVTMSDNVNHVNGGVRESLSADSVGTLFESSFKDERFVMQKESFAEAAKGSELRKRLLECAPIGNESLITSSTNLSSTEDNNAATGLCSRQLTDFKISAQHLASILVSNNNRAIKIVPKESCEMEKNGRQLVFISTKTTPGAPLGIKTPTSNKAFVAMSHALPRNQQFSWLSQRIAASSVSSDLDLSYSSSTMTTSSCDNTTVSATVDMFHPRNISPSTGLTRVPPNAIAQLSNGSLTEGLPGTSVNRTAEKESESESGYLCKGASEGYNSEGTEGDLAPSAHTDLEKVKVCSASGLPITLSVSPSFTSSPFSQSLAYTGSLLKSSVQTVDIQRNSRALPAATVIESRDGIIEHTVGKKRSGLAQFGIDYPDVSNWNADQITRFFIDIGYPNEAKVFTEQEIDGRSLLLLKRSDVLSMLGLKLGPAVKIYRHISNLQEAARCSFSEPG